MPTKIIMPQLGESVVEGTIAKWLKDEGDPVEELDALLEVSTDKVDSEVPSPAAGTLLKILVPEGETVQAGTVIAWIGQPGESVPEGEGQGEQGAATGKQERAPETAEPGAGKSAKAIEEAATSPVQREAVRQDGTASTTPAKISAGRSRELGFISPIVARLAQEHDVDLSQVPGTGDGGRITKKDVLAYIDEQGEQKSAAEKAAALPTEEPAPWETPGEGDLFRPTEMVFPQAKPKEGQPEAQTKAAATAQETHGGGLLIPLSNMRRRIAEHMVTSKRTSPHVTTVMEADLQRVVAHYQSNKAAFAREGVKLSYTAYFVAATLQALRAVPLVNSSWTDEGILIHPRINIGLAVSLGDEGLIVPVLKNADDLSLRGIARAVGDLAERARGGKLSPDDVRDGTFTITNYGISGSLFATPVINQPQCGILGVGAIQKRVVVLEDEAGSDMIAIRPMVYLSFTFDHRILDGASADEFLANVVKVLQGWQ